MHGDPLGSTCNLRELFNVRVTRVRGVVVEVLRGKFLKPVVFVDQGADVETFVMLARVPQKGSKGAIVHFMHLEATCAQSQHQFGVIRSAPVKAQIMFLKSAMKVERYSIVTLNIHLFVLCPTHYTICSSSLLYSLSTSEYLQPLYGS